MAEGHPFIDNGSGYPTPDSVREALNVCQLNRLADVPATFKGEEGSMTDLITRCEIRHLVQDWPKGFIGYVVGIASGASQRSGGQ